MITEGVWTLDPPICTVYLYVVLSQVHLRAYVIKDVNTHSHNDDVIRDTVKF